ncbi:hypothetical protein B296_00039209 [Ensete ventricosum]|uniref:Uncharacterized protein n=1 Tax=Ensete ventricosum TaxID=4639 RepID=A0A426Y933_ENSVE|nr:hypothetical protein B296_00039209 [Ensete ventricosum]
MGSLRGRDSSPPMPSSNAKVSSEVGARSRSIVLPVDTVLPRIVVPPSVSSQPADGLPPLSTQRGSAQVIVSSSHQRDMIHSSLSPSLGTGDSRAPVKQVNQHDSPPVQTLLTPDCARFLFQARKRYLTCSLHEAQTPLPREFVKGGTQDLGSV